MEVRLQKVSMFFDVEAMFRHVKVHADDRSYFSFYWLKDGNLDQELTEHQIRMQLFGATSSP